MKKTILLTVFFLCIFCTSCAHGNRNLPPEAEQNIKSVSDTNKCQFIQNAYLESRPSVMIYYIKLNVYNAGGDSYKIISVNQENIAGLNAALINIEIYKCDK